MAPKSDFGRGLRLARKAAGLSQEDFSDVSSRTYVSSLERGLKSPTLEKVEDLAAAVGCHPLTLLALAYLTQPVSSEQFSTLLDAIREEAARIVERAVDGAG